MTPVGTSNNHDNQNKWEESTDTHTDTPYLTLIYQGIVTLVSFSSSRQVVDLRQRYTIFELGPVCGGIHLFRGVCLKSSRVRLSHCRFDTLWCIDCMILVGRQECLFSYASLRKAYDTDRGPHPPVAGIHSHRSTTANDSSYPTIPQWDESLHAL